MKAMRVRERRILLLVDESIEIEEKRVELEDDSFDEQMSLNLIDTPVERERESMRMNENENESD